tara:strand:+ start:205 stop:573 length:369 start_codon:yes stop_codon:yes gene_type:complete
MAAPNVVNVSSIYGKTTGLALTSSSQDVLTCAANKLLKVNSIIVANVDGANADDVTVKWYNADNTTAFSLASTVTIPADTTLVVLGKDAPIYLEEGDKIQALGVASSGDLEIIVSYEELDDA